MRGRVPAAVTAASLLVWIAGLTPAAFSGEEVPDSLVNPATGVIEVADSYPVGGSNEIRHVVNPGGGAPLRVTVLTNNAADDFGPKIVASPGGVVWVTWWRAGAADQVLVREFDPAAGTWLDEQTISKAGEASRRPVTVHDGQRPWVAYEVDGLNGREVAALEGGEFPQPWPTRTILGPAAPTGEIELRLSAEAGHVWASWLREGSALSWVEYKAQTGTWTLPLDEAVDSSGTVGARARIRSRVLGQ